MSFKKIRRLLITSVIIVVLDQVTKAMIVHYLDLYHSIKVIPGFFSITHIHNPGGAFGFLANQSSVVRVIIFLFVSILALGFIFYFYHKTPETHKWLATGFALIFSGAIGNLIDRVRFGTVVDFLDVYINNLHWPAFNIADSAITIGMGVFIYHIVAKKMPE